MGWLRALALRTPSCPDIAVGESLQPSLRKDRTMPREPVDHGRIVYVVPPDFPERLELLQEESGLPWAEIARRLGTYPYTVWRWYRGRARPHFRHQMALLDLADELGLAHLLTAWTLPDEARREKPAKDVPPGCESPGRKAARRRGGRHRRG